MKKYILLLLATIALAVSCDVFDHTSIWDKLNEHEQRIEELEKACSRLNSNVEALQTILGALQGNDYVTNVTKIMEDGVEVGYSITFAKGGTVTIYHGTDGEDGGAPKIGIKKASDGQYYWTADGEWLTAEDGEKIPAAYADGGDGRYITPQFRVDDGAWYVSLDNGNSWREIDVLQDSYTMFTNVEIKSDCVVITMSDGNQVTIPTSDVSRNITSNFVFTDNTSITASNGTVGNSTRIMKASGYVDVSDASSVSLSFMKWTSSSGAPSGYGLAFYDADKKFISGVGFPKADPSLGSSAGISYIHHVEVPSRAVYLRTTYHMDEDSYGRFTANKIVRYVDSGGTGSDIAFPPYNTIGSPHQYVTDWDDKDRITPFANVDEIYAAYDELATQYPRYFKRNEDIGTDASGSYAIRHYTLGMLNPSVTSDRAGETENLWSDEAYPRRRILLNGNIHGWSERYACYGAYLTVKEILESSDEWAMFIKNNLMLEVVPAPNPWGYDNKTSNNTNGKNLNRTYFNDIQSENQALIDLIDRLMPIGLCGIIDYHNTGDSTPGYLVAKPSYSHWKYYAVLAAQLEAIAHDSFLYLEGTDRDNFFHLWDATGNNGQLHQYADYKGLLGCTFEVGSKYGSNGSILSKMLAINIINAFGTYVGN